MQDVQEILAALTAAIKEQVRAEVRAELIAELGGARTQTAKAKPGPKPKLGSATEKAGGIPITKQELADLKVRAGVRRSQEQVESAGRVALIWLQSNPGSRVDQMAESLGVPVKDLQRPIAHLLEIKAITKKGKLRGTTYTAKEAPKEARR
jgi:hypothetical protein